MTTANIATVQINSAHLPDNAAVNVVVAVTQSAQTAATGYVGGALGANNAVTVELGGNKGTVQLSFAGGTIVADMAIAVNAVQGSTGVSATASSEYTPDGRLAVHVVDGSGLIGNAHVNTPGGTMWLNTGRFALPNDFNPQITFDLGAIQPIHWLKVWNYNEDIPGILITGDTAPDRLKEAQESGFVLLHKPVPNIRLRATIMHAEFQRGDAFQKLLLRYTQALLTQIAQTAVCNRLHAVEQRLCRWLLLSHDRVHSHELQMTQEFIAHMLGGRRESVTVAAGQ